MPKQKPKPHLQDKSTLFVEAESAHSAPAPSAETAATHEPRTPKTERRAKGSRPKGRSRH
ncbi:hypothetical protein [Embleya sp. NBC_00896]|uniref:hypothetical protein n=1 Tax=Embleya sp. NBC_00896 TaxID=2975961 RepID=UPI00386A34F9|nr:hypothetical protein OG928_27290 [Embleya sp. NBC_00896]